MKKSFVLLLAICFINIVYCKKKNNTISAAIAGSFHANKYYETGFAFQLNDALEIDKINHITFSINYQKWKDEYSSFHPGLLTFFLGDKIWAVPNKLYVNPQIGISQGIGDYPNSIGLSANIEAGYKFNRKQNGFYTLLNLNFSRDYSDSWINAGLGYSFSTRKK